MAIKKYNNPKHWTLDQFGPEMNTVGGTVVIIPKEVDQARFKFKGKYFPILFDSGYQGRGQMSGDGKTIWIHG